LENKRKKKKRKEKKTPANPLGPIPFPGPAPLSPLLFPL